MTPTAGRHVVVGVGAGGTITGVSHQGNAPPPGLGSAGRVAGPFWWPEGPHHPGGIGAGFSPADQDRRDWVTVGNEDVPPWRAGGPEEGLLVGIPRCQWPPSGGPPARERRANRRSEAGARKMN